VLQTVVQPGGGGRHRSGRRPEAGEWLAWSVGQEAAWTRKAREIAKEDTLYLRLGKGSFFRRTGHGIAGAVTAGKPGGGRTVAWSLAANAYGSSAIATLWSPAEYRTAGSILERGAVSMAETAGTNLLVNSGLISIPCSARGSSPGAGPCAGGAWHHAVRRATRDTAFTSLRYGMSR
jgi:hypothetical protein